MHKLRWPATLLLLGIAAALVGVAVQIGASSATTTLLILGAILSLILATVFGKRGV